MIIMIKPYSGNSPLKFINNKDSIIKVLIEDSLYACSAGITEFYDTALHTSELHKDCEGIYILSGTGVACVSNNSFTLAQGDCYLVPPHTAHSLKSDSEKFPLKVYWFHTGEKTFKQN